ncbi:hypothetical protein BG000_009442 [Podila horticola]|nr:hypothetical protein BG000_009442 [Podila horticola]
MSATGSTRQFKPLPGQEFAIPVPPIKKPSGNSLLPPSTAEDLEEVSKPRVLISGGGIGGLTLAILLLKANIPFLVLERAKEIKPLGSAIILGSAVTPLFMQLGIYDEFVNRGKVHNRFHMLKEDLTPIHSMDVRWLADSIPRERILLGKRVLSLDQNEDSVLVRCSDNSSYYGDILVGADGAYSAVRQNLYKVLKKKNKLPSSDDVALPFGCVCLVGQTIPLDPEEFPHMNEDHSQFHSILGISTMCTNTVCWMVIHFLDKDSSKRNDSFRNSEWGPEAAEALAREVRDFKVPGGKDGKVRTLGEYVDKTPRHLMSKVMLEEIVFDTWYGGRTVLMGDACHKMNPAGGVGAVIAIHDAVTLANWFATLKLAGEEEILNVFKEYRAERYPVAKEAFETSQVFIRNLGKNMMASLIRGMIKRLPLWLFKRVCLKMVAARHQASFLPLIEEKSKVKPLHQRSLHETLPILKDLSRGPPVRAGRNSAPVTV